jgi:hypothetical protein
MCQTRLMSGTSKKSLYQESLRCCSLVSYRVVTTIACRHIGKRRNVDLAAVSNAELLSVLEELCARKSSDGTVGAANDTVHIVGKR